MKIRARSGDVEGHISGRRGVRASRVLMNRVRTKRYRPQALEWQAMEQRNNFSKSLDRMMERLEKQERMLEAMASAVLS